MTPRSGGQDHVGRGRRALLVALREETWEAEPARTSEIRVCLTSGFAGLCWPVLWCPRPSVEMSVRGRSASTWGYRSGQVDRWTAIARRLLLLLASGSLMSVAGPREAAAAGDIVHVISVTQRDARGDERPDVTTIDCRFRHRSGPGGSPRRRRRHGGLDGLASSDRLLNDTWLYDIGADGSVQLIVAYGTEVGRTVAHVYDDRDEDGVVSYDISDGRVVVEEIRALDGADRIKLGMVPA